MKTVLFLCVANSARSQMAEGLARSMAPPDVQILSAGSRPSRVHPTAIQVMAELGIDLTTHCSQGVEEFEGIPVDRVITLCQEEVCPVFLGSAERLHWPFPDPAGEHPDAEAELASFRQVRDRIRETLRNSPPWESDQIGG